MHLHSICFQLEALGGIEPPIPGYSAHQPTQQGGWEVSGGWVGSWVVQWLYFITGLREQEDISFLSSFFFFGAVCIICQRREATNRCGRAGRRRGDRELRNSTLYIAREGEGGEYYIEPSIRQTQFRHKGSLSEEVRGSGDQSWKAKSQ